MARLLQVPPGSVPAPGSRSIVRDQGLGIVLFNQAGRFHAIDESCPHGGGSLAVGRLDGLLIRCPAHGLHFDISTGCMRPPSGLAVRSYPVHVADGSVTLEIPSGPNEETFPCK